MSDPLDFDDGLVQCGHCGASVPEGHARPVVRSRYTWNFDRPGQSERSRQATALCLPCYRRLRRQESIRRLGDWFMVAVAIALAVAVIAAGLYGVLYLIGAAGR
jgi:hypothetical protein